MIKAEGKYGGRKLVVVADENKITFNGVEDKEFSRLLQEELKERHPMGGTFFPEVNSRLNLVNTLANHFFDTLVDVSITGEEIEEIPSEEGVYY